MSAGEFEIEAGDCLNALRAMATHTERLKAGNPEPVRYEGQEIEGYTILFKAGTKIGIFGQGLDFSQMIVLVSIFLQNRRKELPPADFRAMTLPLLVELTDEVSEFMVEIMKEAKP